MPFSPRAFARAGTVVCALVAALGLANCASTTQHEDAGLLDRIVEIGARPPASGVSRDDVLRWAQGTYIVELLTDRDSVLDRWPARIERPIRVYVEPPPAGAPDRTEQVRSAFDEWVAIGIPIAFEFVEGADDPEVTVRWVKQLGQKTGNTVWRVDQRGWMRGADVVLATHFADGKPLDPRSLHAIALHEIGHLIGLGHSGTAQDIMAPLVRVASLSPSDRATARLLYALPAGRVR